MSYEWPGTTYIPEVEETTRRQQAYKVEQDGAALWKTQKEELRRQKQREQSELRQMLANYAPWGKPGGGAPCASTLRKKNVPLEPQESWKNNAVSQGWTNSSAIKRLQEKRDPNLLAITNMNKLYDDKSSQKVVDSLPDQDSKKLFNEEVQVYRLTGGVELVPLLTSRRYNSQPQTTRYHATDATRPGYTIEALKALNIGNREYIAELADQMRRKREKILEEQRLDRESCRRHFDTWKKFWGRPGHGAPIDHVQRNNLHDILYRPAVC